MSRAAAGLPWRRIAAWVVDWLVISVYAAALVPVGLLLVESSVRLSPLGWNAVSFVVLVLPATVWAASWERTRRGATPGKRLLGLRVRTQPGGRLSWGQAMARNSLKIAVPWEAGHTRGVSAGRSRWGRRDDCDRDGLGSHRLRRGRRLRRRAVHRRGTHTVRPGSRHQGVRQGKSLTTTRSGSAACVRMNRPQLPLSVVWQSLGRALGQCSCTAAVTRAITSSSIPASPRRRRRE